MSNPLAMSDEDFLNQEDELEYQESDLDEEVEDDSDEDEVEESEVPQETEDDDTESEEEDEDQDDEEEDNTEEEETTTEDTGSEEVDTDEGDDVEVEEEETSDIDYKAEYEKLFQPIKANGTTIQLNSIDEAVTLIQKGVNYHEKMVGLKPNLKLLKMLENNSLLDESKLSYLIDLDKKNPAAIEKLIKESGLDPLDVDVDKESNYTPSKYSVTDQDMNLEEVLQEIKRSPVYNKTINIIGSVWDERSQLSLQKDPGLIKAINAQVEDGTYDKVTSQVKKLKLLGQLDGLSDLDAYVAAGNSLFKVNQPTPVVNKPVERKPVIKTKSSPEAVKRKKIAAGSTKGTSTGSKKPETKFNPLAMSDEEFERQFG